MAVRGENFVWGGREERYEEISQKQRAYESMKAMMASLESFPYFPY